MSLNTNNLKMNQRKFAHRRLQPSPLTIGNQEREAQSHMASNSKQ